MIVAKTKIYNNYQTSIPKPIREEYNITQDTIVEWGISEAGEPEVKFREKVKLKDIIGLIK